MYVSYLFIKSLKKEELTNKNKVGKIFSHTHGARQEYLLED